MVTDYERDYLWETYASDPARSASTSASAGV